MDIANPTFRLLVGLGNPGREYIDTRHNVGFMIADRIAAAAGADFRTEKAWQSDVAKAGDLLVCKPLTFMNVSGDAVLPLAQFYKIPTHEILVVLDDMALPLGKLRFRGSGSSGGHNGLQSIIERLGGENVPRLRVGIGSADPGQAVGHVLGRFSADERSLLDETLARAVEAVNFARRTGLPAAMNAYN